MSAEGDGGFEEGRAGGESLQGGVEILESWGVCSWGGEEHEGVACAVGKLMESPLVRVLDCDCVGQAVAGS